MSDSDQIALRVAYLNVIQGVISRLANSSSVIKGASVTVLSAMLAFAAGDNIKFHCWMFILPGLAFMAYHTYFLQQERAFIKLYNDAASQPLSVNVSFVIDGGALATAKESYFSVFMRNTIWAFHVPMICGFVIAFLASGGGTNVSGS